MRFHLLAYTAFMLGTFWAGSVSVAALPAGNAPPPVPTSHFPDRLHAFVWRNWTVVGEDRLAKVLGTSVQNVRDLAASMGLPPQGPILPEWKTRGYITVLRRNWHLVPYEQLLTLLDMSEEQLAYCLREDDFLFIKLGGAKPACPPLSYAPPSEEARSRAAEIRRIAQQEFGDNFGEKLGADAEPRFAFVKALGRPASAPGTSPGAASAASGGAASRAGLRYIYSYFAVYGEPLSDPKLDPFPDGLLERLAQEGVNGVWLHTVLRTLAPCEEFPEFGEGWQVRLESLRRLVERAGRYGIKVYLYMNEPRAMPAEFFNKFFDKPGREGLRGVPEGDYCAMCTSDPRVRKWLSDSLAHVFSQVPHLGGVFTITASENLTHCASHGGQARCARCKLRSPAEIVAEVNTTISDGVHRGNPQADTLVWDWGWDDAWTADAIARLPKSAWLMSVSEWSKPITRGGIASTVGEYSLSAVGPGPRAQEHWQLARKAGLRTAAKVQFNNSWELSAVPYLPVMDLVAEHCHNLASAGVNGMMLSWSLGGYPSPNLRLAQMFSRKDPPTTDSALDELARSCFGATGAADGRAAWTAFSKAFGEFPFNVSVLYCSPMQYGPADLLYLRPTGYHATMVGFPYDDLAGWRGPYPPEVFAGQLEKVAAGWRDGLPRLERAAAAAPAEQAADATAQLLFARVAALHFQTAANQARFVMARNALLAKDKPPAGQARAALVDQLRAAATAELDVARRAFDLDSQDSRVAYEASNHYYYLPIDLAEKVLNCRYILDHGLAELEAGK